MKKKILHIIREENFLSLAGNLVIAIFGLATFAVMARSFSLEEFGEWVLFLSAGSFIEMLRFGITSTGVVRFLSGVDKDSRDQLVGSNALIGLVSTTGIAILVFIINIIFNDTLQHSSYKLFFQWYPILAFINLPWNNALVVLQADRKYSNILLLKSINSVTLFMVVLINAGFLSMSITQLVWCLLIINGLTSVISVIAGWDGLKKIRFANRQSNKTLLHFGKYTAFTLVGTNLLRSADIIIISMSPMGSAAVALYSIPLKLTELQQIPLRSFTATAFPKMSKASLQGKTNEVKNYFYSYTGAITYLFVLVSLLTFLFADLFIEILAGKQYFAADPITGASVITIVRIFSLYGLLLPLDRMTGIGLDSINKPQVNALKVLYMVIANIIGDIIAIFIFNSLVLVAVSSILFTIVGIYVGMRFLDKELHLEFKQIFTSGITFYKEQFHKFFYSRQSKMISTTND